MSRNIAISDIHGCRNTFEKLLNQIQFSKTDKLYLLGDYIDRGPDSKGVIDLIWKLESEGFSVFCLKGNHEQMLVDAFFDRDQLDFWLRNGGNETVNSFQINDLDELPEQYLLWMKNLDYFFEVDHSILVHAGFQFKISDPFAEKEAMLWSRRWYDQVDYNWLGDRFIIHGHTPVEFVDIFYAKTNLHETQILNIDNGCVYKIPGFGNLIAYDMTNNELYFEPFAG